MDRLPLLAGGIAATAGALLARPLEPGLFVIVAVAAVVCVARFRVPAALALGAAFAVAQYGSAPHEPFLREHTQRIACTLLGSEQCLTDAGATLEVSASSPMPLPGTRVLLRGRIVPFDGPRNPGEPDGAALARERGVDARIVEAHVISTLPRGAFSLRVSIARAQSAARTTLARFIEEPTLCVLAGALWGEKNALPPDLKREFQETGTVHILVTAGLHLGVVALLAVTLLKALRLPRLCVASLAAACIWGYALFSGMHLPSMRAAVMATFGLAAYAAGAAPLSWNAYGAALLAVALLRPQSVGEASFVLSFSCVGAILLLAPRLETALEHFAIPERVREAVTLSIATQVGTWPVTASVFLLFAPYAVLANLVVVPVVGLVMIVAGLQLVLSFSPLLSALCGGVESALLEWIVDSVTTFATLPHAAMPMSAPHWFSIAFYDAALVFAVRLWDSRGRTLAAALVLLATLNIALPLPHSDGELHVTVLDVGQADGIVIETPARHVILVDAGGRLERGGIAGQSVAEAVGERVVVPFLRREGISAIDAIILSHPHGDHAGGVAPVLRNFDGAGSFADGGQQYSGYAYRDALGVAKNEAVAMKYPRAGDVWRFDDGVTLTFIGPSLPFIESDNTINDNSIAFVLQYKHFRMLFTGDAGVAAEQRFLNEGIDLHADILKVGHHGSAYSSSVQFIAAVHPRDAIISVGRHNMFGHPAPSTLETLQRFGARVYRTDRNGAVTVISDGHIDVLQTMPIAAQ